jgi:UDPglucose 6-dehydrogenase/GDP-mannose 6-dehydrogenase
MRVSIIGAAYVGLVTGACLAEKGHKVICVDVDQDKIDKINVGISPSYEDGLTELLKRHAGERLTACSNGGSLRPGWGKRADGT